MFYHHIIHIIELELQIKWKLKSVLYEDGGYNN